MKKKGQGVKDYQYEKYLNTQKRYTKQSIKEYEKEGLSTHVQRSFLAKILKFLLG